MAKTSARGRVRTVLLFVSVLLAIVVIAFSTVRAALQLDKLGQEAVFEVSLGLAREKAKRLDQQIVEQDNVVFSLADPEHATDLPDRWLPTSRRETPTVRAIVILDATGTVVSLTSRVAGGFQEDEGFRRLLVHRMLHDVDVSKLPPDELRHLHQQYDGQSYLISYWVRVWQGRRYAIVAWHDLGRIVRETMPMVYAPDQNESDESPRPFNVVDEEGRLIFGPPVRSGEFSVSVQFPTTLYSWRIQVAPSAGEATVRSAQRKRLVEVATVAIACVVLFAGIVTILAAAERERVVRRNRIGLRAVHIDPKNRAEPGPRVLCQLQGIAGAAAVAHADVEIAVRPEHQVAAVVIAVRLQDIGRIAGALPAQVRMHEIDIDARDGPERRPLMPAA